MANPQVEDGYTRIANEILEGLARVRLSAYEWNIVMVVIRKTYGYGKKVDRISLSQFSQATAIKTRHVSRTIKFLIHRRILTADRQGPQFVRYGLQKNHALWRKPPPNEGVPE